ncbi:MAG: iron ABC transporter permease [Firmicutes bacterium]|nr:iron ABC transporter permease [Bacillota bacterium]
MRASDKKRYAAGYLILAVLAVILVMITVNLGSVQIAPGDVLRILSGGGNTDPQLQTEAEILLNIRLPRVLAALILGGALAVSGVLLQTFFSNPIAGPFVLGISSGARLVVALVLIACLSKGVILHSAGMALAAFAGSMLAMGFVLAISGRVKNMSVLIVCGVMVGYLCSAVTDFLVTFADDTNIVSLHDWSLGSFSGISWENVRVMTLITAAAMFLTLLQVKPIGAYQLGETYAANMGVNIRSFRIRLVLLSSVLSACVTAFAGPIAFLGVAVPHLVRNLFRTSKPAVIIPASFLGGGTFCLFCDLIARTAFAPAEISISSVTSVFGAPIVIWIMMKRRKEN